MLQSLQYNNANSKCANNAVTKELKNITKIVITDLDICFYNNDGIMIRLTPSPKERHEHCTITF